MLRSDFQQKTGRRTLNPMSSFSPHSAAPTKRFFKAPGPEPRAKQRLGESVNEGESKDTISCSGDPWGQIARMASILCPPARSR